MLGPGLLGTLGKAVSALCWYFAHAGYQIIIAGHQHKKQRKMLTPVFSVKHLREMTPLFYDVIHRVRRLTLLLTMIFVTYVHVCTDSRCPYATSGQLCQEGGS